jgi:four helix bundle protein
MNQEDNKIRSFTDLTVWQEAHKLSLMIYKATKNFPRDELFGLVSQMRRAAVSITSSIAEGFSRQSYKEKAQFYCISQGSNTEIQNQLILSRDIKYLPESEFREIAQQSVLVHKLLNGIIKNSRVIHNS